MSEAARHVRIKLRNVVLAEETELTEQRDLVFVELADPPPVRTLLAVEDGSGDGPKALEVTRVVEVPDAERTRRGFYGHFVESSALERFTRVGTEHLSAGYLEGEEPTPAANDDDESTVQMAVPAPVVDPDPSEPIDLREVQSLEMAGIASQSDEDEDSEETEESDSGTDDVPETDEGEPAETTPAASGRRRRGRKRR